MIVTAIKVIDITRESEKLDMSHTYIVVVVLRFGPKIKAGTKADR